METGIPFIGRLSDGKNCVEIGEGNPFIPDWNSMVTSIIEALRSRKTGDRLSLFSSPLMHLFSILPPPRFSIVLWIFSQGRMHSVSLLNTKIFRYFEIFVTFFFLFLPIFWWSFIIEAFYSWKYAKFYHPILPATYISPIPL